MKTRTMKKISHILTAVGFFGVIITACACGDLNSFKETLVCGAIGLALTIGGLVGGQLLRNEAEFREYKQRKLNTYGN